MANRKIKLLLFVVFSGCLFINIASGLGTEEFGDKPIIPNAEWNDGVAAVVRSPGRVYSRWVNGDESFYYKGDAAAFNEVLKKFAAIKAPVHRLIVKKEYGKVESFDGTKGVRFDWKLNVPSGIYRSHLIREKGENTEQIHPSLTVPLSSRIRFEEIILPAGVDIVFPENVKDGLALYQMGEFKKAKAWSKARVKWQAFVEPYLGKIRNEEKDPSRQCVEVKSALISKYLPKHKIYVIEISRFNRSNLFALSITGEIIDLNRGDWSLKEGEKLFKNEAISAFFEQLKIIVSDANEALEIGRLVEEISFAPNEVMFLKSNTNSFRIFDKRLYQSIHKESDWEYSAERKDSCWIVTRHYIGPPASIIAPPKWEITVNEGNQLVEICHR